MQQWVRWYWTGERQGWWEHCSSLMMKTELEQRKQIQVSRETPETKNMQKKKLFCPLYTASTSSTQPLGSTQKSNWIKEAVQAWWFRHYQPPSSSLCPSLAEAHRLWLDGKGSRELQPLTRWISWEIQEKTPTGLNITGHSIRKN